MKYGLFILCWIATVLAEDTWTVKHFSELQSFRNKCAKSLNLSDDVFAKYQNREFLDSDALAKSYVTCVFEELGVFSENGFNVERLILQFGAGSGDATRYATCASKVDEDTSKDIWAFRAFKCFTKVHRAEFYTKLDEKE